jgi:DNA-binding transcriptional ArsR family regulator
MKSLPQDDRCMLACLGDSSRLRIVEELSRQELCVTEVARAVQLSQSCTTRHLQVLTRAGLVGRHRHGKRVVFNLRQDDPRARALLSWVVETLLLPVEHRTHGLKPGERPSHERVRPLAGPEKPKGRRAGVGAEVRTAVRQKRTPDGSRAPEPARRPSPTPTPDAPSVSSEVDPPSNPTRTPHPAFRDLEDFLL